jgi:hypothetical protein
MAKKKKRAAPKKKEEAKKNTGFWRGIYAVTLIIAGIVLAFGAVISAPVPQGFWDGVWWAIGAATIIAPVVLIYLGGLKFLSEDHKIPLPNFIGALSFLVFFAGLMHTVFLTTAADGTLTGGHGGSVGEALGGAVANAMGRFLASLVFLLLTLFAVLFTFGIEPRVLIELFKRDEKEGGDEDLGALKSKMAPGFQLHEGVPVEHHAPVRGMPSLRNAAQKMTPEQEHAALTTVSDPDWQYPPLTLLSDKQDKADAGNVTANAERSTL